MKHLRKYLVPIFCMLLTCVLIFILLPRPGIRTDGANAQNVYNTVKELSSEKYMGRKYGTGENMEAVKYIEEQFRTIGLKPAGNDNTYLRKYYEAAGIYKGTAAFEVIDKNGSTIKRYKFGEDFKEQEYGNSAPGEVTSGCSFLDSDKIETEKAGQSNVIAVVPTPVRDEQTLRDISNAAVSAGYKGLITTVPDGYDLRVETADIGDRMVHKSGYELPTLIIKERVMKDMMGYRKQGCTFHMKSTFDVVPAETADVCGMIQGKGGDYLLITSHLDGVGCTNDGTYYPGALDNASGVGALIELARYIKSQHKVPSKNLVFIALNCEEGGLLGSTSYVQNPVFPLQHSTVLNLDMIGEKGSMPMMLMYNTVKSSLVEKPLDPSSKIRYYISELAGEMGIQVKEVDNTSGSHAPFNSAGVPAVTLCDFDESKIHTPADDMDNMGVQNISRGLNLAVNFISVFAYGSAGDSGYSIIRSEFMDFVKVEYPSMLAILLIIMLSIIYRHRVKSGKKPYSSKIPVLSISCIILLSGIVSYFPIKYPYAPSPTPGAAWLLLQSPLSIVKSLIFIPLFAVSVLLGIIPIFLDEKRKRRWDYTGNGNEPAIGYYLSLPVAAASSSYFAVIYGGNEYLMVTPDFARSISGKVVLYVIISVISYIVSNLMSMEINIKKKGYARMIIFSAVLFILLSSFYMPVAFNKYIMNLKARDIGL